VTPPVVEHGRLTLRLPQAADVPWIFHACQDPEIQRFTTIPSPYRAEDAVGWIRLAAELCASGRGYHFLVSLTETGELLGSCGLDLGEEPGRGEIGYWVDRDQRGQGVATAAVRALEWWATTELAVVETVLRIVEANTASIRVAERCGYVLTGPDDDACKGQPTLRYVKQAERPPETA
jgi:RimJ/RimL family protein N-acetyltransferase